MKKCSKCNELKEFSEFHRHKQSKDGLKSLCKVCNNANNAKHRRDNPKYYQKWRDDNKDVVRAHNDKYYADNHRVLNAARVARAKANPEAERKRKQRWYEANKDKVMANKRRRRDRKVACGEEYSLEHRRITLRAFENKCYNCGSGSKLHIDHHRPLIKGHPLSLRNAVVLCRGCNLSKGSKNPEEFYVAEQYAELEKILVEINIASNQEYIREIEDDR